MSKNLTIIAFAELGLLTNILCFRQIFLSPKDFSFSILLSQLFTGLGLIACILLFAKKIRSKKS